MDGVVDVTKLFNPVNEKNHELIDKHDCVDDDRVENVCEIGDEKECETAEDEESEIEVDRCHLENAELEVMPRYTPKELISLIRKDLGIIDEEIPEAHDDAVGSEYSGNLDDGSRVETASLDMTATDPHNTKCSMDPICMKKQEDKRIQESIEKLADLMNDLRGVLKGFSDLDVLEGNFNITGKNAECPEVLVHLEGSEEIDEENTEAVNEAVNEEVEEEFELYEAVEISEEELRLHEALFVMKEESVAECRKEFKEDKGNEEKITVTLSEISQKVFHSLQNLMILMRTLEMNLLKKERKKRKSIINVWISMFIWSPY